MTIRILHEIPGRIRFSTGLRKMSCKDADLLGYYLRQLPEVEHSKVYERSGNAVVTYAGSRQRVIEHITHFSLKEVRETAPEQYSSRELNDEYQGKLVTKFTNRVLYNVFVPAPVKVVWTVWNALHYLKEGVKCLLRGKLEVPVLDATAIAVSVLRRDFKTAGSVMFLLGIGDLMEEWTHKKSVADLAGSMSLNVSKVWLRAANGQDVLVSVSSIKEGDKIVVGTGAMIPLDGVVYSGEAMVNQASLTGESAGVKKEPGSSCYAGTAIEEGELVIEVKKASGSTRYEKIIHMIEDSEKMKSSLESNAEHLADRLVPYSFGLTALTYLFTRNLQKTVSTLMVDFSCALKLSMPVTVLSAMRECSEHGITVKGGKFMEAVAEADTIVFDKTGTLTKAQPTVREIIPFGGHERNDMLRLAACLEEHFPHSIATAVVQEAKREGLSHKEMHADVHYVIAHGIASSVGGEETHIGSYHFIFEDEKCSVPKGEEAKFEALPDDCSLLYLSIGRKLAGVICIEDPLREEAKEVVSRLKQLGIKNVVMMTGDSERTAKTIAAKVGVDHYYAEVLPEDKANFVEQEKALGHKVIMVGDGVNDSPALSAASAGVAISEGSQLAREIADITISKDDLYELVKLKMICNALVKRIHSNYRVVMGFNSGLIAGGILGWLQPSTSALLHNVSTLGIGMHSMTNLLEEDV